LGPLVQLNAFGDLWTGWPFGGDWTDNKTLFAFIFWVIAAFSWGSSTVFGKRVVGRVNFRVATI